ncbi:ferredoxin-type protein NapF [Magnetovibrio sp.]|uniref:ferredoxin-type protein NapF n=1 Tax=Magnetovibrio sp. TaxID=2024836 RepID=UPI002F94BFAA
MQVSISRRALFTGRLANPARPVIRPPWSAPQATFLDACDQCNECLSVCAEGVIVQGGGGFPEIDFQNGACTFCGDCAQVCEPGAIVADDIYRAEPWAIVARFGAECLSQNGVTCRVCGDRCDARAIRFQLAVGGVAHPIVNPSACTGCGACVAPCPVGAVEVVSVQREEQS